MTEQTVIKNSRIVAGIFYLLLGAFMVAGGVHVSLTDDRRKMAIAGAISALAGVATAWLGVRRLRDAKVAGSGR